MEIFKIFCRVYATEDQQESAKELLQTSLNDWLESSEEAARSKNQQVEDNREKQMETLLDEMKNLSSRVEKMEKQKKKELDFVPSKSSKSKTGVLSSTTFKSELKQKVRSTIGSVSDSDSSRPTSPVDTDAGSGKPSPRRQVYFRPDGASSLDKSKSSSSERPVSKISSTLSEEISAPDTPIEAEFAPCPETDDLIDEPDSSEALVRSRQISYPKKTKKLQTESSEVLSLESKIPATRPPSPPPPPKNAKLPAPRNLIY